MWPFTPVAEPTVLSRTMALWSYILTMLWTAFLCVRNQLAHVEAEAFQLWDVLSERTKALWHENLRPFVFKDERPWYRRNWTLELYDGLNPVIAWNLVVALVSFVFVAYWLIVAIRAFVSSLLALRLYWWFRGVDVIPESMLPGSEFTTAKLPRCQMSVSLINGYTETHVGFSIRIAADMMVMPNHVLKHCCGGFLLRSHSGKAATITEPQVTASQYHSDLAYVRVPGNTFTNLGVAVATLSREDFEGMPAVCVGIREGKMVSSSGLISEALAQRFGVKYTGSTVPGFSGAAYMHLGRVFGMHIGSPCLEDSNLGITSALISIESAKVVFEDYTGYGIGNVDGKKKKKKTYEQRVMDQMDGTLNQEASTVMDCSVGAKNIMSEISKMCSTDLQRLKEFIENIYEVHTGRGGRNFPRALVTQTESGLEYTQFEEPEYPYLGPAEPSETLEEIVAGLTGRVATLERKLERFGEEQMPRNVTTKCDVSTQVDPEYRCCVQLEKCEFCNKLFRTEAGKEAHTKAVHLKQEAAVEYKDGRSTTQVKPAFLGHRPVSEKKNSKNFQGISNSKSQGNQPLLKMGPQRKTQISQQVQRCTCVNCPQSSGGPIKAETLN